MIVELWGQNSSDQHCGWLAIQIYVNSMRALIVAINQEQIPVFTMNKYTLFRV